MPDIKYYYIDMGMALKAEFGPTLPFRTILTKLRVVSVFPLFNPFHPLIIQIAKFVTYFLSPLLIIILTNLAIMVGQFIKF